MCEFYNPVVRTFGRYRAALCDSLGVPRHAVRPGTLLAELVPPRERRRVGNELRARGLAAPDFRWTVGESAVHGASYRAHAGSGYCWSRGDITLKVRLIVAKHLALRPSEVRPESRFVEDLGAG